MKLATDCVGSTAQSSPTRTAADEEPDHNAERTWFWHRRSDSTERCDSAAPLFLPGKKIKAVRIAIPIGVGQGIDPVRRLLHFQFKFVHFAVEIEIGREGHRIQGKLG
jgi:hypothetical protein